MRKEKDSTNGNKRVVKNVVKVAGALAVVFVLFQIPTSIFSFQDSTNSDDHVKDYIITEIDTGEEVNTTEEETVEEAGAENVQYVEEQEEEVVDEYPVHNTERSSFSANDDTIPIVISDMMLETFGNTPTITLSVDNATDKDIKQALFLLYFYDDNGMPVIATPGGNPDLGDDEYLYPIMVTNLPAYASSEPYESTTFSVAYTDIYSIGVLLIAYETFDGEIWNNSYAKQFVDYSGGYVSDLREEAPGCVFDFFRS